MDYRREWEQGQTFAEFLATAQANVDLWNGIYDRVVAAEDIAAQLRPIADTRKLLILSADWCGDAVNVVPHVARLADAAGIPLRVIDRDEFPHVMDAHLTRGARSIPIVIALDDRYRDIGCWGPRPHKLQAWFVETGRAMPAPERYREIRRWYAMDRGRSIATEIAELVQSPAGRVAFLNGG